MNERDLLRIIDCLKYTLSIVALSKRTCWTVNHALTANNTAGLLDSLFTSNINRCVNGPVRDIPYAKCLDLLTYLNTSKALDAFIVITNEWERRIPFLVRKLLFVRL